MSAIETPAAVVKFWRAAGPDRWFEKDAALDDEIRRRFLATHEAAAAGKLTDWEQNAQGALALLILLDQFPRNLHRGAPQAFATDAKALALAKDTVRSRRDLAVPPLERVFGNKGSGWWGGLVKIFLKIGSIRQKRQVSIPMASIF